MSRTPIIPIATALNNIMQAKQGADVRDSIHDAIASCYNDVSSPELNTAALETALQAKIDQGEMAALTIGDGTITGAKLANGTIPKAKLDPSITFDADSALDTTSTNAIQNKVVAEGFASIKADLEDLDDRVEALESGGGGSGLTEAVKTALLQLAQKVAYIDDDGQDYYDDLYDALYPPADLVSISAVYTQSGTVYDTDTLNDLKSDLVVTAHYSDSTTGVVTGYTLSGTLTEGTSTITVTYGGQTTTFTVTVSHVKQVVRHYFSNLEYTDGKLIKTNKSQVSVSNSGHVVIPYVQGMTVVTVMPSNWIGNYPAIMKDNGTSYSNANAVQGETVSSNTFIYSQTFDDESGIENIVTNFQSTYISQCYYETEE